MLKKKKMNKLRLKIIIDKILAGNATAEEFAEINSAFSRTRIMRLRKIFKLC
jgi:hypothetical protein